MPEPLTPVRRQYLRIKKQYPQAIVLFRLGDFYETFDEDARITSRELDIVLTSREMGKGNKVPLAGIPYHALDGYLARLINRGYKVAICEQMTKPGETKGMMEREVVRLVTPGTVVEPGLLDSKANNYLASVVPAEGEVGLAFVDITTSEFAVTQLPLARAVTELQRLNPSEVIAAEDAGLDKLGLSGNITRLDSYRFGLDTARQALLDHFGVASLEGYGCAHLPLAVRAAGAIVHYIRETQKAAAGQLTRLSTYATGDFMALDAQTQHNLELFQGARSGTLEGPALKAKLDGSLLAVIDMTKTPGGGRLLRRWLGQPLLDAAALNKRLDAVAWFVAKSLARRQVAAVLKDVADLERLINRVRSEIAGPREVVALRRSLEAVPKLKNIIESAGDTGAIDWLVEGLQPCGEVVDLVARALVDEPAAGPGEGGVIRPGFSKELDELRDASGNARQYLASLEARERERTGIKSLKIGFNNVFGYYIEVSKPNLAQVPPEYIRKQTIVNGERYFTPELKEYESLILNARDRLAEMEAELFRQVCRQAAEFSERVLALAWALAKLDALAGLAEVASRYSYVRPTLDDSSVLDIKQGRHPVVERNIEAGSFVPNDICLDDDARLIVLTGPNMSGKSTYLRQVALIVLLAQVGSFVPAASARIGLVDRIFTRIGARDDLAAGQSTFMVEMVETANILNNATPRSLLILDEIGRGTSTYDGLSLARAVAEHIHDRTGARTVFATHYHEMTALAASLPRVRNFNVAVIEEGGKVIFLHRIVPGGVDRSYGIHVAQLAGLPRPVLQRAREVLEELERGGRDGKAGPIKEPAVQLGLFGGDSGLEAELKKIDLDALTPLEALKKLYELKKMGEKQNGPY
jgi:DNA mismatch repair protein MutS